MSTENTWMIHLPRDAAEIINHRVEGVPDCIAEALSEDTEYTDDQITAECERIAAALRKGNPFNVGELGRLILLDAADGSTFFAQSVDWCNMQKMRWSRAANIAEDRLDVLNSAPLGGAARVHVTIPRY